MIVERALSVFIFLTISNESKKFWNNPVLRRILHFCSLQYEFPEFMQEKYRALAVESILPNVKSDIATPAKDAELWVQLSKFEKPI